MRFELPTAEVVPTAASYTYVATPETMREKHGRQPTKCDVKIAARSSCTARPARGRPIWPDKFDYYSMDCYRIIGDNQLAEFLAQEILRKSTSRAGEVLALTRKSEAELTLGVVAARNGDLNRALTLGRDALAINRRCDLHFF